MKLKTNDLNTMHTAIIPALNAPQTMWLMQNCKITYNLSIQKNGFPANIPAAWICTWTEDKCFVITTINTRSKSWWFVPSSSSNQSIQTWSRWEPKLSTRSTDQMAICAVQIAELFIHLNETIPIIVTLWNVCSDNRQ